MPWGRRRAYDSNDPGYLLRRHSTVDPTQLGRQTEYITRMDQEASQSSSRLSAEPTWAPAPTLAVDGATDLPTMAKTPSARARVTKPAPPDSHLKPQRFSLLRFRHASDSQLSKTARDQATEPVPEMPPAPAIITTAPTMEQFDLAQKRKSTFTLPRRRKTHDPIRPLSSKPSRKSLSDGPSNSGRDSVVSNPVNQSARVSRITFDEPEKSRSTGAPPAYGDDTNSSLALPVSRLSESSRSDGSLGEHGVYATTTTTHTVSTTTTFFRLAKRKKAKGPLFPLPAKSSHPDLSAMPATRAPGAGNGRLSESSSRQSPSRTPPFTALHRPYPTGGGDRGPTPLPTASQTALHASSIIFAAPGLPTPRRDSTASAQSGRSSPVFAPPTRLGARGRSSTKGSLGPAADDESLATPPLPQSSRTSTSTTGRGSLGGLFSLSRLRNNSEPLSSRHGMCNVGTPDTPGTTNSKSQSFHITREPSVVVPERQEGDTPAKYLIRLEEAVSRGVVATILSSSADDFSKNVLRSYMRGFSFFGYPLDMSIRKMLMEVELPKETQHIDRVLQAFANRYHECNPGIYASPDEAYFIAFSILILHTDVFNKNNKHKMNKTDYTKNAKGQGVADEILECFYDNISYTPFIHVEDDVDINGERTIPQKSRKIAFPLPTADSLKRPSREPVDPYTLILDNQLESLRPSLKDVMIMDDPYNYLGTSSSLDLADLNRTFFKSGVLQILSSRSRPEAFMSPETVANPAEAHPGVVDIKITKVGILWRKVMKKKKARSPWQEWGAVLTGSQLYFFHNTTWVKSLMHQYDAHQKHGPAGTPVTFKPPLEQFKPDALISTDNAVALLDTTYKKHKHAFIFVRLGGLEETFLADSEGDMNDWLAKLNYASAFRSAGVRMRGLIGVNYDGQRSRGMRAMDSVNPSHSPPNPAGDILIRSGKIDAELARQVQAARRQIMLRKIAEADEKLDVAGKQLDGLLRHARHLQVLAPIQPKTREAVIVAATGTAANIKWLRMEMWRTRCHKEILAMDLNEELWLGSNPTIPNETTSTSALVTPLPSMQSPIRRGSQSGSLDDAQATPRRGSTVRPSTQPSPSRSVNMDDAFQLTWQNASSGHPPRSHASWELPPLSFESMRTSFKAVPTPAVSTSMPQSIPPQSPPSSPDRNDNLPDLSIIATRLATPTRSMDDEEEEVLKRAGLMGARNPSPHAKASESIPDASHEKDSEKAKLVEMESYESRPKVRRSLQRALREAQLPTHHRSKKGKDSASSAGMTEDTLSLGESEGLARGAGSFTVHGKKASVITFGSEWQDISPEERLKLHKATQENESKMAVPLAIEDESGPTEPALDHDRRPLSVISISTTTTRSMAPNEEKEADPPLSGDHDLKLPTNVSVEKWRTSQSMVT